MKLSPLPVVAMEQLTDDAVALTFAVDDDLRETFAWTPGQHVAVQVPGDDVRRSYSLCPAEPGRLRIGVRRLPGGRFSGAVLDALALGDTITVSAPAGRFGAALRGLRSPAFVAAGSGITPVLAMVRAALEDDGVEIVRVVVANRAQSSVMFLDELADLKDRYPARLQLVHVLSREQQESPLLSGRLDAARFDRIRRLVLGGEPDGWFLCGPQLLVSDLRSVLLNSGVDPHRVHLELFHAEATPASSPAPATSVAAAASGASAAVRLSGRTTTVAIPPGDTVLDAVLRSRADAPYACKGGVCGTCRARLTAGRVEMATNWALEPDEVERGYVLTCQSRPVTDAVELDYDA